MKQLEKGLFTPGTKAREAEVPGKYVRCSSFVRFYPGDTPNSQWVRCFRN